MATQPTITLTPKEIRKAVVAQLIARGVAPAANVHSTLSRAFQRNEAPAINVFSPGNDASGKTNHLGRFDHTERVIVAATVRLAEGLSADATDEAIGDAVDDMEAAIKTAILTSRLFVASFKRFEGLSVEKGTITDGDDIRGHVNVEFRFVYDEAYQPIPEPPAEDPFLEHLQMDVETPDGEPLYELRPIYRVRLVTHNDDDLVTHVPDNIVTHLSQGFDGK
jgi:hypothetical protein